MSVESFKRPLTYDQAISMMNLINFLMNRLNVKLNISDMSFHFVNVGYEVVIVYGGKQKVWTIN